MWCNELRKRLREPKSVVAAGRLFVCLCLHFHASMKICVSVWVVVDWRPRTRPRTSGVRQSWSGDDSDRTGEVTEGWHGRARWRSQSAGCGKSQFICWKLILTFLSVLQTYRVVLGHSHGDFVVFPLLPVLVPSVKRMRIQTVYFIA